MSLEKVKMAAMKGQSVDEFINNELANLPGKPGGLGVLRTQSRGGVDGGAGGYVGQKLQLPWNPEIIALMCRAQEGVRSGSTTGPSWAQLIGEDIDGGYFVGFSIRRLSERYHGWLEGEDEDDAKDYATCDGPEGDSTLPKKFKGATDADALVAFCEFLAGRVIMITKITTIQRKMNTVSGTQIISQKLWDYKLVSDDVPSDTMMTALHRWHELAADDKKALAKVLTAIGVDPKEVAELTKKPA